jgi:DNA-binding NtrC family response regulator
MLLRRTRVLMLDDSADDRELFARLLALAGGSVDLCMVATVEEAIHRLHDKTPFECLLLDYHLGAVDGPKVMQLLREEFGELPCACVMLTGELDRRAIVESLRAGAWDYLSKDDLPAEELVQAIERAVQVSRLQRELTRQNEQWAEAEQRLHEAELRAAELDGVRRAVATYMHELNSPLTGLLSYTKMMLEDEPSPEHAEYLNDMQAACQRMGQVLRQMESLTDVRDRVGSGKRGPLELKPLQ